jgi:hypothetical protein
MKEDAMEEGILYTQNAFTGVYCTYGINNSTGVP